MSNGAYTKNLSALDVQVPGVNSEFPKESQMEYFKIEMSSALNSASESNSFDVFAFFLNSDESAGNREVFVVMSNGEG